MEQDNQVPLARDNLSTNLPIEQSSIGALKNPQRLPANLSDIFGVVLSQHGSAFAVMRDTSNPYALPIRSRALENVMRSASIKHGVKIGSAELNEIKEYLCSCAEMSGVVTPVWQRYAATDDGLEIDLGDATRRRVRISPGAVEVIDSDSETIFYQPPHSRPMTIPAEKGDVKLLKQYVNLDPISLFLFTAWLAYTASHPKTASSKFVILAISGGQGSGKSFMCRIIKALIDPSVVGVEIMPNNVKDLSIAAQHSHVLCYDNLRQMSTVMADALCVASTGGSTSSRQLYSDDEQKVLQLHVALVLNGIHSFIDQPDLAQRCLPLHLKPLIDEGRKSEAEMLKAFEVDLPVIQRGLFDLIAEVLKFLPDAKVTHPERMFDFSKYLAAMEMADGVPAGIYQMEFSNAIRQGQRDALLDNLLAASVLEFGEGLDDGKWSGTPAQLLADLNSATPRSAQRSLEWPNNPIALSKRVQSLQAGLLSQGVHVEFSRGKERTITIMKGNNS